MIKGYSRIDSHKNGVLMYLDMLKSDVRPDNYTFPFLLKGFTRDIAVEFGKELHCHVLKFGFDSSVFVQNALISTYCLCGEVDMARGIFYMSFEDDDGLHELFRIKAVDDDLHELFPEYLVQMLALPDTFMDEGLEVIPKSQAPREETPRVGNLEEGTPQEGRPHEHSQDDMSLISNSIPQR